MRKDLEYPFDSEYILKKSKHIKKELLADGTSRIRKRIAVLGGSTTHDVIRILELFLLNQGIEPVFYESEYGQYWQDVMFGNEELDALHPDIIYIDTSNGKITDGTFSGDVGKNPGKMELSHYPEQYGGSLLPASGQSGRGKSGRPDRFCAADE